VSLGFSPDAFWDQTFETLQICLDGKADALEREHNERAWLAWHIAAMPRMKDFPKLEKLLYRQKSKREMTPDEMWALMVPLTYSEH
jgi:hypothetical protein